MAMTQFAATSTSGGASSTPSPPIATSSNLNQQQSSVNGDNNTVRGSGPDKQEVQLILGQFDAKINQMMDYPAKDIINALTMLAERVTFAPEIVSFLETKIHRAPPNYKLPIFYLTDSILKNVGGPYTTLFGRIIVPLYCNCVKQVSGKDLRRFIHVLNTWETTRLFSMEALAQMRAAANRAQALAEPSVMAQPVSFSQQPPPPRRAPPPMNQQQQQQDMELRSLLTKLQNEMGIHPTEHMSLEEVRTNNPDYYNQLLEYQASSKLEAATATSSSSSSSLSQTMIGDQQGRSGPILPIENAIPRQPVRDPRRNTSTVSRVSPTTQSAPVRNIPVPQPQSPSRANGESRWSDRNETAQGNTSVAAVAQKSSGNVVHLMELLKRKKQAPIPPTQPAVDEVTNDPPRAPDAAAVMSILQKLKGLTQKDTSTSSGPQTQAPYQGPPPPQQPQPPTSLPPPPPQYNDTSSSRMWFSDKIVAHKDRVESNVQKMYAALPLVCRESGLRFKEQSKLDAHLDFLFKFNRAQKELGKGGISRSWYLDEEQWVIDVASENAPRETTSSSFFDRKESEDDASEGWDNARVPVDESITRCRICGENFVKSWDEEEEDWMYTNAVIGKIHRSTPDGMDQETIFHKYCYDTVMANSKHITLEHLIPGTPQSLKTTNATNGNSFDQAGRGTAVKRAIEEEDSDSDEDDIKRVKMD